MREKESEEFEEQLNKSIGYVVHWDEKKIANQKGEKENRVAVVLTGIDSEIFLSGHKTSNSSGKMQADTVFQTLEKIEIKSNVLGMSFDITSSNFGLNKGAAVLFEKQMEEKLLYLPCRHHIYDLVVRNVAKVLFGNTVGPSTPFFEKFKTNWNSIKEKPTNKLKK